MIVLEVRHAELMESITKHAAERGITYGAIIALDRRDWRGGRSVAGWGLAPSCLRCWLVVGWKHEGEDWDFAGPGRRPCGVR